MKTDAGITIVTEQGVTGIPEDLRRALGLTAGSRLRWQRLSDTEVLLRVLDDRRPNPEAMRGFARRFRSVRRSDEWMQQLREGPR